MPIQNPEEALQVLRKLDKEQRGNEMARLLQGLLADQFQLTLHHETRNSEAFALVIAGDGLFRYRP